MKTSSNLLLYSALTALMVACGGGTPPSTSGGDTGGGVVTPPSGSALSADRIQGTLSASESRGGTLTVYNTYTKDSSGLTTELSSGPVGADGSVSLPLNVPPSTELDSFLGSSCTFSGTQQGATGKVAIYLQSALSAAQGDPVGDVNETVVGSGGKVLVLHTYADGAQMYKGSYTCSGGSVTTFDVSLNKGWNALTYTANSATAASVATAPADTRVELTLSKYTPQALFFLDTSSLTLKAGESVKANAVVYQVGALSGKIDLSTDVPGVTIDPSSITLAPVGTQTVKSGNLFGSVFRTPAEVHALSVGTQKFTTSLTFKAASDAKAYSGGMNLLAKANGATVGKKNVNVILTNPSLIFGGIYGNSETLLTQDSPGEYTIQLYPQGGFTGEVAVTLTNLPTGMRAVPQTLQVTQGSVVKIPVTVGAQVPAGHYTGQVQATYGSGKTITQDAYFAITPKPEMLIESPGGIVATSEGEVWFANSQGFLKRNTSGTYDAFRNPGYNCGRLVLGADGNIWQTSSPFVRVTPSTGSATILNDPRRFSGCAGDALFDSKGRAWTTYIGVQRLDFQADKSDNVLGSESDSLRDIADSTIWASSNTSRLVKIDADTLKREELTLNGVNVIGQVFARGDLVWLDNSIPYVIASYSPATGELKKYEVVINGKRITGFNVLGVDGSGRHWIEVMNTNAAGVFTYDWVLYDPASQRVVVNYPGLERTGYGTKYAIDAKGTMWYVIGQKLYQFKP